MELTPNGAIAIIRGSNYDPQSSTGAIAAIDAATGAPISILNAGQYPNVGRGWTGARHSDLIAVTNDRAVTIGSYHSGLNLSAREDTTQVDVLQLVTTPPAVLVLTSWTLGGNTGNPLTEAGEAHDVAMTPNGAFAVVHSRNFVHVFGMAQGGLVLADQLSGLAGNVPAAWGLSDLCSPKATLTPPTGPHVSVESAVDSVAVTDTRAVVITSREKRVGCSGGGGFGNFATLVYVYDLAQNPIARVGPFLVDVPACGGIPTSPFDADDHAPHDVEITPDGGTAIVTCNGAMALIDISGDIDTTAIIGAPRIEQRLRRYRQNRDTIVATSSWVVTTGDWPKAVQPSGTQLVWAMDVFDLTNLPATGTPPSPSGPSFDPDTTKENLAHDVTLSSDARYVGLRAGHEVAIIDLLASGGPALRESMYEASSPDDSFSLIPPPADQARALCGDSIVANRKTFVTVGAIRSSQCLTRVQMWRYTSTGVSGELVTITPSFDLGGPQSPFGNYTGQTVIPADLTLLTGGNRVAVRSMQQANNAPGANGPDLVVLATATGGGVTAGQLVASFGASDLLPASTNPGHLRSVDCIAAGPAALVVFTGDLGAPTWTFGPTFGSGWIQAYSY